MKYVSFTRLDVTGFRGHFLHNTNTQNICRSPKAVDPAKNPEQADHCAVADSVVEVVQVSQVEQEEAPVCCNAEPEGEDLGVSTEQRKGDVEGTPSPAGSIISISSDTEDEAEEQAAQRHSLE